MIRCTKCQTLNPSDAILCSSCQSLLQWTGVPVHPSELSPEDAPAGSAGLVDEDELAAAPDDPAPEEARLAAEAIAAEEARQAAEAKAADEARQAAEAKAADEARQAAEAKAADEARQAAEEARLAAEAKAADEARLAAAAKAADEAQAADEAREAAAAKAADEARLAAEAKAAEEARQAAEEARLAAEAKAAEEARQAAEAKAAEEARQAAEEARLAAEAKAAEEARRAAEAKAADEARRAAAAALFASPPSQATTDGGIQIADDAAPAAVRPGQRPTDSPSRRPTIEQQPGGDQAALSARPTQVESDDDQPGFRKPTDDLPIRTVRPADPPPPVEVTAKPGDIICQSCSMPNDPALTFCRRCGTRLAAPLTAVVPTIPWYRRLMPRRAQRAIVAGERPKGLGQAGQRQPSVVGRVLPFIVIAVVAFSVTSLIAVPGVRGFIGGVVDDLRLRFLPEIADVHPVQVDGPGVGGTNGLMAVDNNTASFWLSDPATGRPSITVGIGRVINLGGLVVHTGSSAETDFTRYRRPSVLELTFPGTDRPPVQVTLQDVSAGQPASLDVRDVEVVVISVVEWFEEGAGGESLVAVREIEFKERRLESGLAAP